MAHALVTNHGKADLFFAVAHYAGTPVTWVQVAPGVERAIDLQPGNPAHDAWESSGMCSIEWTDGAPPSEPAPAPVVAHTAPAPQPMPRKKKGR